MIAVSPSSLPRFVEDLLREQQDLSAVEQFTRAHAELRVDPVERRYRSLLPATAPQPGQQYGFEVNLDRCSGCKACVTACHAMNGLDESETWREVGLLLGGSYRLPVLQHVTTACHHCIEPGCMSACPTLAYEKDVVTGIVKHLDDQCFGCQYCVMACPYEVPKYHAEKGIVRKCDMCSSRLKAGEAPACVQACPHEAIRISLVDVAATREASANSTIVPTAPASRFTLPTTQYRTERASSSLLRAGDEDDLVPEHHHVPLMLGLIFSQIAVGLMCAACLVSASTRTGLVMGSGVFGLLASMSATAHLGRPWLAYRALLGWRTSWLSREIIALALFQGIATLALFWPSISALVWMAAAVGLSGVFCSIMIYAVTPRPFWSFPMTTVKFLGTTMLAATQAYATVAVNPVVVLWITSLIAFVKLMVESRQVHVPGDDRWADRSSRLLRGALQNWWFLRCSLLLLSGVIGPLAMLSTPLAWPMLSGLIIVGCLAAELVERTLFFRAAAAPRMPGRMAP